MWQMLPVPRKDSDSKPLLLLKYSKTHGRATTGGRRRTRRPWRRRAGSRSRRPPSPWGKSRRTRRRRPCQWRWLKEVRGKYLLSKDPHFFDFPESQLKVKTRNCPSTRPRLEIADDVCYGCMSRLSVSEISGGSGGGLPPSQGIETSSRYPG